MVIIKVSQVHKFSHPSRLTLWSFSSDFKWWFVRSISGFHWKYLYWTNLLWASQVSDLIENCSSWLYDPSLQILNDDLFVLSLDFIGIFVGRIFCGFSGLRSHWYLFFLTLWTFYLFRFWMMIRFILLGDCYECLCCWYCQFVEIVTSQVHNHIDIFVLLKFSDSFHILFVWKIVGA
jgi:hypothetical protein